MMAQTATGFTWESIIYQEEEDVMIGQRLGVSYLRSQKESVSLCVDDYCLQLYQSSMGILTMSGVVWDAGLYLSDYLIANRTASVGRVLDIGCGTGVCGIAALFLGATSVTFTDAFVPPSFDDNISQLTDEQKKKATFISHDWSSETICPKLKSPGNTSDSESWDTVLCGDLLYDYKAAHEPLLKVLKQILFKKAIFAYKRRHDDPEKSFFRRLSEFCSLEVVQSNSFKLSNIAFAETSGLYIIIATPIKVIHKACEKQ
jgi:SAM-dependent methyltransferase